MQLFNMKIPHFALTIPSGLPKLATVGLFLVAGAVLIKPGPAYACRCVLPESASIGRDASTAVFTGEVVSITPSENGYTVDFSVSEHWKGTEAETVRVRTAVSSAACGYTFDVGQSYLVYAVGEETDLSVNICGRTAPLDNAADDIIEFGDVPPETTGTRAPGCQSID
ncbi:hypothetical protein [cf. Phormidesmis sp. LEGE 11477]|uniref:hypothetical protein n=1 Tax=cf. Phormidesmis sp. LEGE 11477 TaxID=1828680 RepID=UPI001882B663|nr:hypothetical protein [cf. Phormidesmis sp. LEGE 11477]MBE9062142.1 hypothetical protein [cf. Phormidesmis sp. LEGE 11477]